MSDKQLTTSKFNRIADQLATEVGNQITAFSSNVSEQEARRLTLNLCVAANKSIEDNDFSWSQVKPHEFVTDALRIATLGLDASNNEVYVIPYRDNKSKGKDGKPLGLIDLDVMISAWGWRKLVMQYAVGKKVDDMIAFVVRKNDTFKLTSAPTGDTYIYEQEVFGTSEVVGYVTVVSYEDGTSRVMTHSKADIEKRHKASKAKNSPAWAQWYDEMAIAKAVRRHCKRMNIAVEPAMSDAMLAIESPQRATMREVEENANMIDVTIDESIEPEVLPAPKQESVPDNYDF